MLAYEAEQKNEWVRSGCELCLNLCGILVRKVDGKIVKIEGDPENPHNRGFICAKGNAGMLFQYSPSRVTSPLMRTNPEKGLGVDPGWKEVSWDEALDVVAERLRKIRQDDPRKLYVTTFLRWGADLFDIWADAFGTQSKPFSSGFYCGNNVHPIHFITEGAYASEPDAKYAKYLLLVGSQFSSVVNNSSTMEVANEVAEKRPGRIKVVVVDPVGSYAASRAEEWVPIRPGTDAAFLLSLANLLINEYRIYDADYLQRRTNAPYLVGPSGRYVRDQETGKPLIWDSESNSPRPFDHPARGYALEGEYITNGELCKSAFQLLEDHIKKYTPESVSEVTTIPVDTIRRIAKEFGEAAGIGGVIDIKGKELPFRPACLAYYRGLSSHKHSFLAGLAANLLNTLVGAVEVPGGSVADKQARATTTKDGLMTSSLGGPDSKTQGAAYPPRKVISPKTVDLFELFPVAVYSRPFFIMGMLKPELYKTPYRLEMMIQTRTNLVKTAVAPRIMEQVMKKIPFTVSITLELDETAEFADVVFPDVHYLERLCLPNHGAGQSSGDRPWYWHGQVPVATPPFTTPWGRMVNSCEILLVLAERAGFIGEVYDAMNHFWNLKEPYALNRNERYKFQEIVDRRLRNIFGEDKGLSWFVKKPLVVRGRTAEEMYPGAFRKDRIHIYHEYMLNAGEEVRKVANDLGLTFWDTSDYQPLPDWKPCPGYSQGAEFDLYVVNYKVPQQPMSYSQTNVLLQTLTDRHRDDDLLLNSETARTKGITDGDEVCIKTIEGKVARGRARVTELVHPEVIGCQGNGGRFAKRSKAGGVNFNDLVPFDEEHIDFVSAAIDSCIRAKVSKA